MTLDDAISQACSDVDILPPKRPQIGRWTTTDTKSGRNGKGDGRLMIGDGYVTAWNWQTQGKSTVSLAGGQSEREVRQISLEVERSRRKEQERLQEAERIAKAVVAIASPKQHAYLIRKGFQHERALVVRAPDARRLIGSYIVPDGARDAIIMPCRIGQRITSLQLVWEEGAKKFLYGGRTHGTSHRIAAGNETWLCEGLATGLSLRQALRGFKRSGTILCCFSAANIVEVATHIRGRCFVAADNDKAVKQLGGEGTGAYYARQAGKPFVMPPEVGQDFNDFHIRDGIFAVQSRLIEFLKGVPI